MRGIRQKTKVFKIYFFLQRHSFYAHCNLHFNIIDLRVIYKNILVISYYFDYNIVVVYFGNRVGLKKPCFGV